jgi:hypothetical protein
MRRLLLISTFAATACLVPRASADEIVLKDGRTLVSVKPYAVKGKLVLLTQPDGKLVSIALAEIDVEKTAAAAKKPSSEPTAVATPVRPLTPADAARQKSGRKATLVLTDEKMAQTVTDETGDKADKDKKEAEGEERVEIANVNATKDKDGGYTVNGSVVNVGRKPVSGISVVVEAVGDNNATLASTFGSVAKDSLEPGEKSTFFAKLATEKEAKSFRYVPRWVIRVPVKQASEPSTSASGPGGAEPSATPAPGAPGSGGEKPAETAAAPTPIPRPDIPARPANAPVGSPSQPGGVFLPKPTGDQPKSPGGGL